MIGSLAGRIVIFVREWWRGVQSPSKKNKKNTILRKWVIGSLEICVLFVFRGKTEWFQWTYPTFPPPPTWVAFNETQGLYDHHRDPIVKLKEPRTFKELVTYVPFDIRDLDDGWLRYMRSEVVRDSISLWSLYIWRANLHGSPENDLFAQVNQDFKTSIYCVQNANFSRV